MADVAPVRKGKRAPEQSREAVRGKLSQDRRSGLDRATRLQRRAGERDR